MINHWQPQKSHMCSSYLHGGFLDSADPVSRLVSFSLYIDLTPVGAASTPPRAAVVATNDDLDAWMTTTTRIVPVQQELR